MFFFDTYTPTRLPINGVGCWAHKLPMQNRPAMASTNREMILTRGASVIVVDQIALVHIARRAQVVVCALDSALLVAVVAVHQPYAGGIHLPCQRVVQNGVRVAFAPLHHPAVLVTGVVGQRER